MPEVVVLVLNDPDKIDDVLAAWLQSGIPGVTIIPSTGLRQVLGKRPLRDDLPLFPSLNDLVPLDDREHRTLFSVVPDGFGLEKLVEITERITGVLDDPHTGILFTIPVGRAWGLRRT